jgi:DNA polymerase/3'-5' exonuclease PolX
MPAGSWRRRRETIADIDILVERRSGAVIERVHGMPWVERAAVRAAHRWRDAHDGADDARPARST